MYCSAYYISLEKETYGTKLTSIAPTNSQSRKINGPLTKKNLVAPPWKSLSGCVRLMRRVWELVNLCLALSLRSTITLSAWSRWAGKV